MSKRCTKCTDQIGDYSTIFCDYHAGYHAGRESVVMPLKRGANPEYRERERIAVRERMRKLRAKRRAGR